ncbi:MAG: hypothetical protein WC304_00135 [Candidatus Gracilibacteria bacterium]|jgi:hypothetical protein
MKSKLHRKKLITRFLEGSVSALVFLLILGITYAFSSWNAEQPPLANPANGNVQLVVCPACPTGYHVDTATNTCVTN